MQQEFEHGQLKRMKPFDPNKYKVKIINLTPHIINIFDGHRHLRDIPVSDRPIPRCHQESTIAGYIDGITITCQDFAGAVENVPYPEEGVYYVVSRLVAEALPQRTDFLVPGPLVRDANGQPCGCQGLAIVGDLPKDIIPQKFGRYKSIHAYIDQDTGNEINIFRFDNNYGANVSRGPRTYGGPEGMWELAVLKHGEICYSTEITDDVVGWLEEHEVELLLSRIEALKYTPYGD